MTVSFKKYHRTKRDLASPHIVESAARMFFALSRSFQTAEAVTTVNNDREKLTKEQTTKDTHTHTHTHTHTYIQTNNVDHVDVIDCSK